MPTKSQPCSVDGCVSQATFTTRSKPAWCTEHLTALLHGEELDPLEPFPGPKAHWLTRCLVCGCVAHYRLEYVLQPKSGDRTCRACYWRQWAADTRASRGRYANLVPVHLAEVRARADANGYEHLEALTSPSLADDPHRVCCRRCGRISAMRLDDMGWGGCPCGKSGPARSQQAIRSRDRAADLFRNSGLLAVGWWDHTRNPATDWATSTVRARRKVRWVCPDCRTPFTRPVVENGTSAVLSRLHRRP